MLNFNFSSWSAFISILWRHLFYLSFISNEFAPNYKFTSKQRDAVNWQLLFIFMFMFIHASCMMFKSLKFKLKLKSREVFIVLMYATVTVLNQSFKKKSLRKVIKPQSLLSKINNQDHNESWFLNSRHKTGSFWVTLYICIQIMAQLHFL